MTYDSWKTTDPRDLYPDQEQSDERPLTELDEVYGRLHETQEGAKHAAEVAASRIKELTAALEEALEYFKENYDVVDGDYGEQLPNKEMRLGTMIDEVLYGIRF
jgi:hypothetical protein